MYFFETYYVFNIYYLAITITMILKSKKYQSQWVLMEYLHDYNINNNNNNNENNIKKEKIETALYIQAICNLRNDVLTECNGGCDFGNIPTIGQRITTDIYQYALEYGTLVPKIGTYIKAGVKIYESITGTTDNDVQYRKDNYIINQVNKALDSMQQCFQQEIDSWRTEIYQTVYSDNALRNIELLGNFNNINEKTYQVRLENTWYDLTSDICSLFNDNNGNTISYSIYYSKLAIFITLYPLYISLSLDHLNSLRLYAQDNTDYHFTFVNDQTTILQEIDRMHCTLIYQLYILHANCIIVIIIYK